MPYVLGEDFTKCRERFPGDQPFGVDVTYDPVFESLYNEIQKLGAGGSTNGLDWKGISRGCVEILSGRSKDLTVACYLTLALFNLHGYAGLADGLEIVGKLLQDHWDGMFPQRPKRRANAVQWLSERLALYAEAQVPRPDEAALLLPLREQVVNLRETARSRLLHEAPSFSELGATLSIYLSAASPALPATADPASPPAVTSSVSSAPAPVAAPPAAETIAPGTPREEIAGRIRALIPALRQADPFSPTPYRLLRSLKWDDVAGPPLPHPTNSNPGATRIQPPNPQQQAALEKLYDSGNWAALLESSEAAFQGDGGTYWLDLQRYTAAALEGLDPRAAARAAETVREEVSRLLQRVEVLPTLYFADRTERGRSSQATVERTPFASEATRQWLETLKGDGGGGAAVFLPPARSSGGDEEALSPDDARAIQELLGRQQLGAAFDLLQAAVERAPSLRSRFRTRLAAARLCFQAQQVAWARTFLEELLRESEAFSFEDWEPETAVDVYQLLALCCSRPARKGGPQDPDAARAQIETLRRKLFRLDLRAAAALEEALRR